MNTNKQWSYEEDQQLFEYIWDHSKYPNSTTMHSKRSIQEFKEISLWLIDVVQSQPDDFVSN